MTTRATARGHVQPRAPSPSEDDTLDPLRTSIVSTRGDPGMVWQRLHRSGGTQAAIGVGWRLLHAALPVRARVAYQLGLPLCEGLCEAEGCGCQETLSHAFMECTKVHRAVGWLLDVFEAITGRRPPRDPRVILVDDHRVWQPGRTREEELLWQRLRLIFLYNVWKARCSRQRYESAGGGDLAAAVIGGAIGDVTACINRDWARTRVIAAQEEVGGVPCSFSGRDPSMTVEGFRALWARRGVLCHVHGTGPTAQLAVSDPSVWPVSGRGGALSGPPGAGAGDLSGSRGGSSTISPPSRGT
jgi:hypothetical protein